MYDDFSGNYICSIANVTWTDTNNGRSVTKGATGTSAVGPDGSILRYNFVNLAPACSTSMVPTSLEHITGNHVPIHTLHTEDLAQAPTPTGCGDQTLTKLTTVGTVSQQT